MADGITMALEGGKLLEAKLLSLEPKIAKKVIKTAVRSAAKVVLVPAKQNAKGMIGGKMGSLIARALQLKVGKSRRRRQYFIRVQHNPKYNDQLISYARGSSSSLSTRKTTGMRHYIPNAIEYGHAGPGQSGGAKIVAPIPYMRSAFDNNSRRAARKMERELFSGIERVWRVG